MTQINIRVEPDIKIEAEKIFSEIGLPLSTGLNMFLKQVVREQRIPLNLSLDPFYSESNMNHLVKLAKEMDNGIGSARELIEVD